MPNRGLAALYNALNTSLGFHLDDEMLALIVDAEMAGEKIERQYETELAHIETCERCATNYSELLLTMQGIYEEMDETAESTNRISEIWNRLTSLTAEIVQDTLRLTFPTPTPALQIREPGPAYDTEEERLLTRQTLPGDPPLTMKVHLKRQTPLTCRLIVELHGGANVRVSGRQIHIHYGEIDQTLYTEYNGVAQLNNIPIAGLPTLVITVEYQGKS